MSDEEVKDIWYPGRRAIATSWKKNDRSLSPGKKEVSHIFRGEKGKTVP
jgi:hypothetical protein